MVGRWEFRHIDHFGTCRLAAIHCRDHRVHCYGGHTSTVNISQAAIGLAVVLIGVALVWATPRLDRFARRSAAPGHAPALNALLHAVALVDANGRTRLESALGCS